ncbi:MAG: hypothetical protein HFJ73_06175 [Eggerthellaceae bacterium]|nr:hypothetical protein [Eggerthellaceae bacterium]
MADNETNGGLSLEALLAAARGASASEAAPAATEEPAATPAAAEPAPAADAAPAASAAGKGEGAKAAPEAKAAASPSVEPTAQQPATAQSQPQAQAKPEPAASEGGFDLAAALGYGSGSSAPERRSSGSSYGSAVASNEPFDLAAALGYGSSSAGAGAEADASRRITVDPVAIAEAAMREEQAQAAADVVAREAIARAAREDAAPRYRSRYADLPQRSKAGKEAGATAAAEGASQQGAAKAEPVAATQAGQEAQPAQAAKAVDSAKPVEAAQLAEAAQAAKDEQAQAEQRHVHAQAVSRMAAASTQAAQAATAAQQAAAQKGTGSSTEEAPVTFKPFQPAPKEAAPKEQPAKKAEAAEEAPEPALSVEELEKTLASQEPAFMSVQESEARAAQRAAEEAAAEEARLAAERAAQEAAAREAAAKAAQQMAAQRAQAEAAARAQAQAKAQAQAAAAAAAAAATAPAQPVRPRKAAVTATEEILVEPLPSQRIGTISYEDAVFADEARQMETAAERKASKKARRYRRLGTFLVIVALLAAAGAVALFLSGTANASEDIETKAVEISESAGRTITYRYRATDSNGTLCPTTEVATFSTGGVLEQSVITMQTSDFETAAHTLANFKKQFQDNAYVDGRVDNSSVVFTLHLSSEHLMKSTYTALVMSNTVGCEVII